MIIMTENEDPIGYCNYCKSSIHEDDEHVYKNGDGIAKLYHIECWKQKNNIEEEVDFDN